MKKQLIALGALLTFALSSLPGLAACNFCQRQPCACPTVSPCCPKPVTTPCCPVQKATPCCPIQKATPCCPVKPEAAPCPAAPIEPYYQAPSHNDMSD